MTDELSRGLHNLTQRLPRRDLAGAVVQRYRRGRARTGALVAGCAVLLLVAVSWAVVTLPGDQAGPGPAASPPVTTAPPSPVEVRTLAGTFYYHRHVGGDREQLWAWTVGEEPRPVTDFGEPDLYGFGVEAWQSAALSPDGSRLAWVVAATGHVVLVDTATGAEVRHDVGAGAGCLPPVWSADGSRLLIDTTPSVWSIDASRLLDTTDHPVAWLDPESGEVTPVGPELRIGCGAVAFTTADGVGALAYEDPDRHVIAALTESGEPLWEIGAASLDERLDPGEGLWRLVAVADGNRYACVDIQHDVVAGLGGGRWLEGNMIVDTTTGAVVAEGLRSSRDDRSERPYPGACSTFLDREGYLARLPEESSGNFDEYHYELLLVGFDGVPHAAAAEPPELYLATLIGYVPAPATD